MRIRFTKMLIYILVISFTFAGCSYSKPPEKSQTTNHVQHTGQFKPSSCEKVAKELITQLDLNNMINLNKEDISKHYGFDTECLEDFSAYSSSQEGNADEIAVFLIKDDKARKKTHQIIIDKIKEKSSYYSQMNQKENKKITAESVCEQNGYIIVTVCHSQDLVFDVLDSFYK